jgi:hypothetical protein
MHCCALGIQHFYLALKAAGLLEKIGECGELALGLAAQRSVALDVELWALGRMHEAVQVPNHARAQLVVQHVRVVTSEPNCLCGDFGLAQDSVVLGDRSRGCAAWRSRAGGIFACEPRCAFLVGLLFASVVFRLSS